jgi:hypothetical protein
MKPVNYWTHEMNLHHYTVSELIALVQKDAYNQALDDIAKLPVTTYVAHEPYYDNMRKESILSLKK